MKLRASVSPQTKDVKKINKIRANLLLSTDSDIKQIKLKKFSSWEVENEPCEFIISLDEQSFRAPSIEYKQDRCIVKKNSNHLLSIGFVPKRLSSKGIVKLSSYNSNNTSLLNLSFNSSCSSENNNSPNKHKSEETTNEISNNLRGRKIILTVQSTEGTIENYHKMGSKDKLEQQIKKVKDVKQLSINEQRALDSFTKLQLICRSLKKMNYKTLEKKPVVRRLKKFVTHKDELLNTRIPLNTENSNINLNSQIKVTDSLIYELKQNLKLDKDLISKARRASNQDFSITLQKCFK
jgi:hypothetical protein